MDLLSDSSEPPPPKRYNLQNLALYTSPGKLLLECRVPHSKHQYLGVDRQSGEISAQSGRAGFGDN
jgi:hypothetical protein